MGVNIGLIGGVAMMGGAVAYLLLSSSRDDSPESKTSNEPPKASSAAVKSQARSSALNFARATIQQFDKPSGADQATDGRLSLDNPSGIDEHSEMLDISVVNGVLTAHETTRSFFTAALAIDARGNGDRVVDANEFADVVLEYNKNGDHKIDRSEFAAFSSDFPIEQIRRIEID